MVAEFGGTLGLFLGFSFITLWDNIILIKTLSPFARVRGETKEEEDERNAVGHQE